MTYAIEVSDVSKTFGPVAALGHVSFAVKAGDVHALVGENGAGKSSLIKILSGVHRPDGGAIRLFGEPFRPADPTSAQQAGVSTMFQESQSVGNLTVAENIFLGVEPRRGPFLHWSKLFADADALLQRLAIPLQGRTRMDSLTSSQAKLVEMARAVNRKAKLLIMDEPTANLNQAEQRILFDVLRRLNTIEGVTVIYISHHLQEIFELCQTVTVLRDGRHIGTMPVSATDPDQLVESMIGRQMESFYPAVSTVPGAPRLTVQGLSQPDTGLRDVSFGIRAGEIYGVYGLADSGRTALVNALFGIESGFSGEIRLDGQPHRPNLPLEAIRQGVILVPEDRKQQGLMLDLDLLTNLSAGHFERYDKSGLFRSGRAKSDAIEAIRTLSVRPPNLAALARGLSGGNQQKIAIGKWLTRDFKLAMFQEPTRGIDVGAKMDVYNVMADLSRRGIAVLMISSEIMEMMGMCHRIGVLAGGTMVDEFDRSAFSEKAIVTAALPRKVH